ncbi:hypothetical protein [Nonomuraea turkmeniaca]|nr:hypothetical protein [Nonomuraea turkmeniaca]
MIGTFHRCSTVIDRISPANKRRSDQDERFVVTILRFGVNVSG